ncbi:hypothetical protein D4764_18G0001070, partial [Takifugu flavidus]
MLFVYRQAKKFETVTNGGPTVPLSFQSRVFKRRQKPTITSDTTSDTIGEDSYDTKRILSYLKESSSSESSSSGSCMFSSTKDTVSTCKTKWLIFSSLVVLALMLPIIFYHLDFISFERPTNSDPVTTSPVYQKGPTVPLSFQSRVFKRRQKPTITSDTTSDTIGEDSYDTKRILSYIKESSSSESSSSGSCMFSSTKDTVSTCKTKWLIFSSLVVLAL